MNAIARRASNAGHNKKGMDMNQVVEIKKPKSDFQKGRECAEGGPDKPNDLFLWPSFDYLMGYHFEQNTTSVDCLPENEWLARCRAFVMAKAHQKCRPEDLTKVLDSDQGVAGGDDRRAALRHQRR